MDAKLQRRIQRYGWDRAADAYERFWEQQLAPAHERVIALAAIRPGERVLDVACGTGLVTFRAAELAGPAGTVMATDISEGMVARLLVEVGARGLAGVTAARMDAESLDVPAASYDVALCALGLMYVPDPVVALRAMHHALRPGGRAVTAAWGARKNCGWAEIFPIVDSRVQSDVCPMFFQLGTGDNLAGAFADAGFTDITTERISTILHYDCAADACGAAFEGGPVALAYSRFDAPTRESAHAEYLASIERWRTGDAYDVPGEFVITMGRSTAARSRG
jgi:ubiquinone/menaquinone biosynthesis C-methylase UbiE